MSEMSTLLVFKQNAEGKVDYLYQIGPLVVKHSVTLEESRRICGDHPITASDRFPSYPCNVRGNYFFPPLLTESGEWPPKIPEPDATFEEPPVEEPVPVEEPPVEEPPKPVKPKTPTKRKTNKPTTTRKKVQKK